MSGPALSVWTDWQRSWDRQQESGLPDREERLEVLVTMIGAVTGAEPPRVLDLACGCGSITSRVLARFPEARVVGVDIDPVLLRIAAGVFQGDRRVTLVEADLRTSDWLSALPGQRFDAAITATALHWLNPEPVSALYLGLAGLLRPGGLFANADQMPLSATPTLDRVAAALGPAADGAGEGWHEWWERVGESPDLGPLLAERNRRFEGVLHPAEFAPGADWHRERLAEAGFSETEVVWRRGRAAVVAAIR